MRKNLRLGRRNLLALALISAAAGTACEKVVVSTVEVTAIQVSPDELSLVVDGTEKLVAVPMSASGTPMPGHPVSWSSSDTDVAIVDEDGMVRALGPGSARISATSGGVVEEVVVMVSAPVPVEPSAERSTVTADPKRLPANGNASSLITVTLRGEDGDVIPVGGHDVVLLTTRGSLGPVTDHGDGTYTAPLTSDDDGDARVTATVDGTRLEQRPTIRFDRPRGRDDD